MYPCLFQLSPEFKALRMRQIDLLERLDAALGETKKPKRKVPKKSSNHNQLVNSVTQSTGKAKPITLVRNDVVIIYCQYLRQRECAFDVQRHSFDVPKTFY